MTKPDNDTSFDRWKSAHDYRQANDPASLLAYVKLLSTYWHEVPELGMVTKTPQAIHLELADEFGITDPALLPFFASAYGRGGPSLGHYEFDEPAPLNSWQELARRLWAGVFYE